MSWTNPPNYITQLRLQVNASAAWLAADGLLAQIHYPNANKEDTFPLAILGEENVTFTKFAYGASPIPQGDLTIFLSDKTSTGEVEQLARDIANEICIDLGLANLSVLGITPAEEPSEAERANGGTLVYECAISLSFGLEA